MSGNKLVRNFIMCRKLLSYGRILNKLFGIFVDKIINPGYVAPTILRSSGKCFCWFLNGSKKYENDVSKFKQNNFNIVKLLSKVVSKFLKLIRNCSKSDAFPEISYIAKTDGKPSLIF